MTIRRTWIRAAAQSVCGIASLAAAGRISAQSDWPRKSIRLVVPFAPGGSSEIVARSVAAELTKQLGHSVFVENKPGGAGTVAMAEVAKADKDRHTLIRTGGGCVGAASQKVDQLRAGSAIRDMGDECAGHELQVLHRQMARVAVASRSVGTGCRRLRARPTRSSGAWRRSAGERWSEVVRQAGIKPD